MLARKCIPVYPPISWSVICWMLTETYFAPGSFGYIVVVIWCLVIWLGYFGIKMTEYPVDVFENFRKPPENIEKEDT